MAIPTFFFSYARQDNEKSPGRYLEQFFTDLENELAAYAGHDLAQEPLGTIDTRIDHGADWDEDLAQALAERRSFVMIETPLYYKRNACGKELGVFLARSDELGIDTEGSLTGVRNVLRIRWMDEEAYGSAADRAARVPMILRRIQFSLPKRRDDKVLNEAIDYYVRKGMGRCISGPYYPELLSAFAKAIRDMEALPPGTPTGFAQARNAFSFDWNGFFDIDPPIPAAPAAAAAAPAPQALTSVVAFHLSHAPLVAAAGTVDFADRLIDEQATGALAKPQLAELTAELRLAAGAENLQLFNAAPDQPLDPVRLGDQLAALAARGVVALLIVDAAWLAADNGAMLRELGKAPGWTGPVIVAAAGSDDPAPLLPADGPFAVPGATLLPSGRDQRVFELRRIIVEARGRVMATLAKASGSASLPLLGGAGSRAA